MLKGPWPVIVGKILGYTHELPTNSVTMMISGSTTRNNASRLDVISQSYIGTSFYWLSRLYSNLLN